MLTLRKRDLVLSSKTSVKETAKKYGCSEATVYRIRGHQTKEDTEILHRMLANEPGPVAQTAEEYGVSRATVLRARKKYR